MVSLVEYEFTVLTHLLFLEDFVAIAFHKDLQPVGPTCVTMELMVSTLQGCSVTLEICRTDFAQADHINALKLG